MARQWRIEYEGALYHVLSRGNEKRSIVIDDEDRALFLETLGRMSNRFDVEIYAFVLMDNHYHLLLRTRRGNLSRAMQWFGVTYTRKFNIKRNRSGHLFQGRFKSFLVENDPYLIQLSCYIHRNPLRAGIVRRLVDYQWSSYVAYAYGRDVPVWLRTDLIMSFFTGRDGRRAYRRKVQEYDDEKGSIWKELHHGLFWGGEKFIDRIKAIFLSGDFHKEIPQQRRTKQSDLKKILDKGLTVLHCDMNDFLNSRRVRGTKKDNRDLLIYLLWEAGSGTNEEIGKTFGMTYSAVSHCVRLTSSKLERDRQLRKKLSNIKSQYKM